MSAEAAYEGGWLITPPLVFEGARLELNLDTGAGGVARVVGPADAEPRTNLGDALLHPKHGEECDLGTGQGFCHLPR